MDPETMAALTLEHCDDPGRLVPWMRRLRTRVYEDWPGWHDPPGFLERDRYDPVRNAFWRHRARRTVLALRDGEPAGCVTAFPAGSAGTFGGFECLPDPEVAAALLEAAETFVLEHGCRRIHGPLTFTMHEEVGLLAEGFDRHAAVMMPFSPPHYAPYLEDLGYTVERQFHTYRYDLEQSLEVVTRTPADGDGVRVRSFDKNRLDEECRALLEIYNAAFAGNWGFTPLSERGVKGMIDEFLLIGDPVLIRVAEVKGEVVGFLLTLPDIHEYFHSVRGWPDWTKKWLLVQALLRRKIRNCRVVTLAVHPDHQGKGLSRRLISSLAGEAVKVGYGNAELSYVDEDNRPMAELMGSYDFSARKQYRIYEKDLAGAGAA